MSETEDPVATWYVVQGGNDIAWRCTMPANAVGGRVARLREGSKIDAPNTRTALPWTMLLEMEDGRTQIIDSRKRFKELAKAGGSYRMATTVFPKHQGVAVFTRPDINRATLALTMQQQGIRTIAETDDNYFTPARENLFLREQNLKSDKHREAHARAMATLKVNVFSTRWLRDRYFREYRRRFGHRRTKELLELYVCRNHIPHEMWPERIERDDGAPLRVGFMGSPSHVWDVNLAYTAFHVAKQIGCETWMVGYNPGKLATDPRFPESMELDDGTVVHARTQESRDIEAKWAKIVDQHIPWVKPTEFQPGSGRRMALPFDIGIAPLQPGEFNCGRSDVKAIEYAISGAAVICADMPPYNDAGWEHRVNCLMARTDMEYAQAVLDLTLDAGLRAELVTAAQEMIRADRGLDALRREWQTALDG